MKALILRADAKASVKTAQALTDKGFQILSVDTQAVAHALIRIDTIDLLVMDERIEGQLTHAIALSGERRNPYLSAILLTDRGGEETDDLYDLIPCLYGMVGTDTSPELLAKLALSAVSSIGTAMARVARNAAEDAKETEEIAQAEPLILTTKAAQPPTDDSESGAPCYADVAIAAPALAEIAADETPFTFDRMDAAVAETSEQPDKSVMLEEIEDAVSAEVAALFRKHPLLHQVQSPQAFTAQAG